MRAQSKGKDAVRWGGGWAFLFIYYFFKGLMLFVTLGAATVHLVLSLKAVYWWSVCACVCARASGGE